MGSLVYGDPRDYGSRDKLWLPRHGLLHLGERGQSWRGSDIGSLMCYGENRFSIAGALALKIVAEFRCPSVIPAVVVRDFFMLVHCSDTRMDTIDSEQLHNKALFVASALVLRLFIA